MECQKAKGWVYLKKAEKINLYLKELVKEYPSREIPTGEFLARCSYDLGFLAESFLPYLDVFKQMGFIEMSNDKIVSLVAKSKREAKEYEVEQAKEQPLSDDKVEEILGAQ
jgi:hypothetical protein